MNFIVQGYPAYAYGGGRPFDPKLEAIVFVHGAALDHSVWQWQSRYFAHHGYAVLAVDLPGHGRSPGTPHQTIAAMADWVADLIAAAGLEAAHVVGHSMGSLVALDTAIRHPRSVASLALLGAAVPMAVGEPFLAAAKDDSPAALDMQSVWGHVRHVALAASAVPGISLHGATRRLVARARPGVQHTDLAACHAYAPAVEALRGVKAPTLVIVGRRDVMTPWKSGEALAREIPGAAFVPLDAGHAMTVESPREVLKALHGHLRARP